MLFFLRCLKWIGSPFFVLLSDAVFSSSPERNGSVQPHLTVLSAFYCTKHGLSILFQSCIFSILVTLLYGSLQAKVASKLPKISSRLSRLFKALWQDLSIWWPITDSVDQLKASYCYLKLVVCCVKLSWCGTPPWIIFLKIGLLSEKLKYH